MELTSAAVATVGAGADVDGLVGRTQTNPQLVQNVPIAPCASNPRTISNPRAKSQFARRRLLFMG